MNEITRKKFWIVSELFFPEETSTAYIMTKIADSIAANKHVHVICGPVYEKSNIAADSPSDGQKYPVTRLKSLNLDKDKVFQRVLRITLLSFQLFFALLRKSKKGDEVLIVTNPATLVLLIVIACKIKKVKCYTIVHDVFPENLAASKLVSKTSIAYKLLTSLFNLAYSKMSVLFVLGRDMQQVFLSKLNKFKVKPEIYVVENWANINEIKPEGRNSNLLSEQYNLRDKIVFQFAGNMGRLQGLLEFCEIVLKVQNPLLHFMFIGGGAVKASMKELLLEKKNEQVTFIDPMPRRLENLFLNACDAGIVSLNEGMTGLGVPSKSYNILSAGKPILFIGNKDGEIPLMINENGIGWCFDQSESDLLVQFFDNLTLKDLEVMRDKGRIARELATGKYSEELIMNKYKKYLQYD